MRNDVTDPPYLTWDTSELFQAYVEELAESEGISEDEAMEIAYRSCDLSVEFEDHCYALTELMQEVNPDGRVWLATVEGFGWLKRSGSKVFDASTGQELIRQVLPDTDCVYQVWHRPEGIEIENAHHDAPTGGEMYFIRPLKQVKCKGCDYDVREDEVEDEFDKAGLCFGCRREEDVA